MPITAYTNPPTFVPLQKLTAALQNAIGDAIRSVYSYANLIWPVGAIYLSTISTNPATVLGFGTWVAIAGRMLVGAGTSDAVYTAGVTGGESVHTLTQAETPAHVHSYHEMNNPTEHAAGGIDFWTTHYNDPNTISNTASIGSGAAHNNMPPYLVIYMWQRTA